MGQVILLDLNVVNTKQFLVRRQLAESKSTRCFAFYQTCPEHKMPMFSTCSMPQWQKEKDEETVCKWDHRHLVDDYSYLVSETRVSETEAQQAQQNLDANEYVVQYRLLRSKLALSQFL